jgi:hypothetical protein
MDTAALAMLVAQLFTAIEAVSGQSIPALMPEIHRVPQAVIQEKFCQGPCRVRAAYHPEWGVYLDDRLDVVHNTFDRSVLLHELVHHLQATSGRYDGESDSCERATREEREAYDIQNRYLASVRHWRRLPMPLPIGGCDVAR